MHEEKFLEQLVEERQERKMEADRETEEEASKKRKREEEKEENEPVIVQRVPAEACDIFLSGRGFGESWKFLVWSLG